MIGGGALQDTLLFVCGISPGPDTWALAIDGASTEHPGIELIDGINSFGRCIGKRFYRLLISGTEPDSCAELLTYDRRGVVAYRRIDRMVDPHGLAFNGTHLIVPCSATNDVWYLALAGDVADRRKLPGDGDAWHVNGVFCNGSSYASAFGRFASNAEQLAARGKPTGIVFNLESGEDVLTGLSCPHDPQLVDHNWVVCDSQRFRVLVSDAKTRAVRHVIDCGGWTRGIAITSDYVFVGLSGRRHESSGGAGIAVIDRHRWSLTDVIHLPGYEVTSLTTIPRAIVPGLRNGFRTNAYRVAVHDRHEMFRLVGKIQPIALYTPMTALESHDRAISIAARAVPPIRPRTTFALDLTIENFTDRPLYSTPPNPILIDAAWVDREGRAVAEHRHALPSALETHSPLRATIDVEAPEVPGTYELRVRLLQQWVDWFTCVDGQPGVTLPVCVTLSGEGEDGTVSTSTGNVVSDGVLPGR